MCDTIVSFDRENKRFFFGKNSDREPGELQFVYISSNPMRTLLIILNGASHIRYKKWNK